MKLYFLIVAALHISLIGLCGCPPKPPVVVVVPDIRPADLNGATSLDAASPGMLACSPAAKLKQEDICDGFFTKDGLSCARCSNVKGCLDEILAMYCATGPCASDPACTYVTDPLLKSARPRK